MLARIPGTLVQRGLGTFLVAAYSAAVLLTWLTFGTHSNHWIPYRTWLGA